MALIGKPIDRVDGRLKVTGAAKYAAEFNQPRMAYAFPVRSTVASGTVTKIDVGAAASSPGVIAVLTPENAPRLKAFNREELTKAGAFLGEDLIPLQDNKIHYFGQFVACVVAETYEQARAAAALVEIDYAQEKPKIDLTRELPNGFRPEKFARREAQLNSGKAAPLLSAAPHQIEQTYTTSNEVHNPMEPHATVSVWDGADKLTIYDATQGVLLQRTAMAYFFDLKPENVRIICPFVGGGFGTKGQPWANNFLSAMAAKVVERPVKLAITRQMMQINVGRRAETNQKIALGANRDGKLAVMRQHTDTYTTDFTQYIEPTGRPTEVLYNAPLREITFKVAQLDIGAPTYMRAPGETPGSFALESAMDEMAYELKIDPVEFHVRNHTMVDPLKNLPFSGENFLECYRIGAEKFGWTRRKMQPRQTRNGNYLVGMGMASATYPGLRSSTTARLQMTADGSVKVLCATQDLGTGTYTIMAQTAADALGIPVEKIAVEIGDTRLPPGSPSFGAMTAASVTPAVLAAGEMLRKDLMQLAIADAKSKLYGRTEAEITFADQKFFVKGDTSKVDSYANIMRRSNKTMMESCATAMPASGPGPGVPGSPCMAALINIEENSNSEKYSFHSFGAQFAEVWVDEDLGLVRVKRFTSVQDVGRILNEKTARSQIIGGVIFGIGAALMEESEFDRRFGNPVHRTLADYHVPVQMDVPEIDVHFIGKPDPHISPIGARGVGEIGIVGVSAAIANAIFNATGKRIRDLPITLDKLM